MKIAVIDNYDSFTYNLVQYVRDLGGNEVEVFRNDAFEIEVLKPFDKIILSPGPGLPCNAGKTLEVLKQYGATKSILGICLGMQSIAEHYGGGLFNLSKVYHGIQSKIKIENTGIFEGLEKQITVGRYHSWGVNDQLPKDLKAIGWADDCLMAIKHKIYDVHGVQFHPESILTPDGKVIIENWISKK